MKWKRLLLNGKRSNMAKERAKSTCQGLRIYFSRFFSEAEKVKEDILMSTRKLIVNPEVNPIDKYRKNNDGSFRAYELHHYRIAYRITEKQIIIVRIRHTKMEPRSY
jgi:plasmid stabilization system protein ParE